jgi:excisionase family DNA binding protein
MPLSDDRLAYRIPAAVAATDIPRSKIYTLIAAGELPVIHVGRTTLILAADLRAFLERRRVIENANGNGGEPISTAPEQPRSRPPPPKKRK